MKTFKNIISSLFIMITIVGSSVSSMAQTSGRIYNDAEAFNLKGHVKECVTYDEDGYDIMSVSFKSNGEWVMDEYQLERDDQNRLLGFRDISIDTTYIEDEEGHIQMDSNIITSDTYCGFSWENNQVVEYCAYCCWSGSVWGGKNTYDIHNYEYDNNGNVTNEVYCDGHTHAEYYTYTYIKYDSHGNWIERKVKTSYYNNDDSFNSVETREIVYY